MHAWDGGSCTNARVALKGTGVPPDLRKLEGLGKVSANVGWSIIICKCYRIYETVLFRVFVPCFHSLGFLLLLLSWYAPGST